MVNAELVRLGYAHAMTVPPNVAHASRFVSLERQAREAGRGLWGRSP
jgi:micrococcal nuclease